MANVLLVDDEVNIRLTLGEFLQEGLGHSVTLAEDGNVAKAALQQCPFDLVISDLVMPNCNGEQLLEWMLGSGLSHVPFVCISGRGGFHEVVRMMQKGAVDYIAKPFQGLHEVKGVVERAIQFSVEGQKSITFDAGDRKPKTTDVVVGRSPAFLKVIQMVGKVAPTSSTVLITGESGTGKEVIAQAIHATSPRKSYPFIAVNCAAIPGSLLESELFGHERGAFTGAIASKPGKFKQAHLGTLFLDEIGELDIALQSKLLRAIQERVIEPVGSNKPVSVDVRIIAATNRDLSRMVRDGTFREDLLYRLQIFPIHLPPLRERKEDVLPLVEHICAKLAQKMNVRMPTLSEGAFRKIFEYSWPGNIRELENTLERAFIVCRQGVILPENILFNSTLETQAALGIPAQPSAVAEHVSLPPSMPVEREDAPFASPAERLPEKLPERFPERSGASAVSAFERIDKFPDGKQESQSEKKGGAEAFPTDRGPFDDDDKLIIRLPRSGTSWNIIEHQVLEQTLQLAGGNVSRASKMLGIPRSHLRSRLRYHNLGR